MSVGPFSHIDPAKFEAAIAKSSVSPQMAKKALDVRQAASRVLHIEDPTMQIGIRPISLTRLSEHLAKETGMPPERIKRYLEDVHSNPQHLTSSEELLTALQGAASQPEEKAIATIGDAKEVFVALKSRRFVSQKEGYVKNPAGRNVPHTKEAVAQFGDNWQNSAFNKWLQTDPDARASFENFCKKFGEFGHRTTTHFLTQVLGDYIKLDSKNQPVLSPAAERKLQTYLNLHPDLAKLLTDNKALLYAINQKFLTSQKEDQEVNELNTLLKTTDSPILKKYNRYLTRLVEKGWSEQELNFALTIYIKNTLLRDPGCTEFDKAVFKRMLGTALEGG